LALVMEVARATEGGRLWFQRPFESDKVVDTRGPINVKATIKDSFNKMISQLCNDGSMIAHWSTIVNTEKYKFPTCFATLRVTLVGGKGPSRRSHRAEQGRWKGLSEYPTTPFWWGLFPRRRSFARAPNHPTWCAGAS
jgi:hypothetical protein